MKKIMFLLVLHIVFTNAFSQNISFLENFENGTLNDSWKITSGKWYIADLREKGLMPPDGENNFALASAGNSEITLSIPVNKFDPETPLEFSFYYWVHSPGSTGSVKISFVNGRQETLSSIQFEDLPQKTKWDVFNNQVKVPPGTSVIQLIFGEKAGREKNTVYLKKICVGCGRKRPL